MLGNVSRKIIELYKLPGARVIVYVSLFLNRKIVYAGIELKYFMFTMCIFL